MQASGDVLPNEADSQTHCFQGKPGSQLDDLQKYRDRKGNTVSAFPVIVDFRRLIQLGSSESIIKGVSNQDLLHAVVGLYDVSLSEMTPDVLYASVCDKWARTVVLVRDINETIDDLKNKKADESSRNTKTEESTDEKKDELSSVINAETDTYEGEDATPSLFAEVFSDEEEEEEEEEEDSDEEDFSKGVGTFIKCVGERREKKPYQWMESDVGIERRLLACATFEKKFIRHKERVVHLTLVSVRPRYRGYGLGKYLLSQVVDPTVVGNYEAVVVHADNSAVEFFRKFSFSDDIVLNSRWSDLAEQFTNCTLMCFLPAFTGTSLINSAKSVGTEMIELEHDFNKWKDKTLESYQAQVSCVMRFKHEIVHLKSIVKTQSDLLTKLAIENEKLRKEKVIVEKEFLSYRLATASAAFRVSDISTDEKDDGEDDIPTDELIRSLQQQVDMMDASFKNKGLHLVSQEKTRDQHKVSSIGDSNNIMFPSARVRSQQQANDQTQESMMFQDLSHQFQEGLRADRSMKTKYQVTTLTKALLPDPVKERYRTRSEHLVDGSMVTELYYCGSLERPERIPDILSSGFTETDFAHGEYGRGLYFSKYPSKAAQFSALGKLLLVEVGLGKVETVTKQDRTRRKCSEGYDSIITPGRLRKDDSDLEPTLFQEYVVFDVNQVLPKSLLAYQPAV